jgi:hypothetical protein
MPFIFGRKPFQATSRSPLCDKRLRIAQTGAMAALCLFAGLFISFGAGLIWSKEAR